MRLQWNRLGSTGHSAQNGILVARKKRMRQIPLTIPEVAFIAGTRGALGAGVGLLLSGRMTESRRRAIGWMLVAIGAVTTIPAAKRLFGQRSISGHAA